MGGSVTARDEETAASEGFVPRTAVVCTRRGAGVDCMFRRFILVFALLCGMILPLGGCSVDTGTSPEDFSKEAREHGLTVEDLGHGCSNAANVIGSDLSDLSDEITFKSCSAAADSSEDGIVMIYVEALDPIDAEKLLNNYSGYLKSKVTNMTNVPNGLEFSYSGDWGAIYAKRYSILFALAGTANRDRAKAFSQSMGYGVKSIDSHDLIRPACYALAFVIGVISYVWKMFRQKGQAARMARLAWQQQATAPSMPMSTDLSQAQFGTFQPQYPAQPQYAARQQFLPQPQADEPMQEQSQTFFPQPIPDQSSALQFDVSSQNAGSVPDAPQLFDHSRSPLSHLVFSRMTTSRDILTSRNIPSGSRRVGRAWAMSGCRHELAQ